MSHTLSRKARSREIKARLVELLERSNASLEEVLDWLWEDFGVRVKADWKAVKRAIVKNSDIEPQDLVSLFNELGIELDEEAWNIDQA